MRIGKHTYKHVKPLPYLLLAPVVVYLGFLVFYPFLRSIYLCFFVTNSLGVPKSFMGFGNFKRVFTDPAFLKSLVQTFKFSALLTGDLYESRELELVKKYGDLLDVDMLKIPHHGRWDKNLADLIEKTRPEYAVITSSDDEPEDDETVELLTSSGVATYFTRKAPVLLRCDGKSLTLEYDGDTE